MNILVACEESQAICIALRKLGHNAFSCDIQPCSGGHPEWHIRCNVLDILNGGAFMTDDGENHFVHIWHIMIAHPPCTRLCNSGVCWLDKRNLWNEMREAALFFKELLNANIQKIAIENPIPHKYAVEIIGRKYDQIVQHWMFGHGETKATCFWLKNLPKLKPTKIVDGREQRLHRLPPSPERSKLRSKTYSGIAQAIADQWGGECV